MIEIKRSRLQKAWFFMRCLAVGVILIFNVFVYSPIVNANNTDDDLIFIHHSCGQNWLSHSLHAALLAKDYIDERNDIYYGSVVPPDNGRPGSLGGVPGDNTNMNHWILWFNDYLESVKNHGCVDGFNKIIMFKSCFPISNVVADGTEPGDPFAATYPSGQTIVNYKAVYRHPNGPGNTYTHPTNGYTYLPLENVFAANPDILFIPVTAPPLVLSATTLPNAARARQFNNWLTGTWLNDYNNDNPGLNNVAPYYWFDLLAYPNNHGSYPNILQDQYRTSPSNSHPNAAAHVASTAEFATNTPNFIDTVWNAYISGPSNYPPAFSNENPSDGATNVPITTSLLSVTIEDLEGDSFDWSITTTPDIGSSSGTGEYNGSKICAVSSLNFNTVYTWYVNATDVGSGNTSSEVYTFTTRVNNPPYAPGNPSPFDGATDVDINADLSWTCSDPDGDSLTYDVYFEENDPTPDELVSNNQSENWYDPGTMEYNTHYYWQIVAWDPYGATTIGPIWDFMTGSESNTPPYPPSNPNPENGSTNIDIDVDLSWIGGDPDPEDTIVFDVYFEANDPTPDNQVADDISETTFDPGTLKYATTYYWRVIAKDNHGASTPGPIWSFTTGSKPDLDCDGSLIWNNVTPGGIVTGGFDASNIGEPTSRLDWEIESYPEWGTWTFIPENGEDLTPEYGPFTIDVSVTAPNQHNQLFSGEITIVNKENNSDTCRIPVSLATPVPVSYQINMHPLLQRILELFPNMFPIIRYMLGL